MTQIQEFGQVESSVTTKLKQASKGTVNYEIILWHSAHVVLSWEIRLNYKQQSVFCCNTESISDGSYGTFSN